MGLKLLYHNWITDISTGSSSTDDESKMIADESWKVWTGDSESTTSIDGIFNSPLDPGDERDVGAIAIVHNLDGLDATAEITLYNGTYDPGNVVYESSEESLIPDFAVENILDDGYFTGLGRGFADPQRWHIYIHYVPVVTATTNITIDLDYGASVDPQIRYVYAGPVFEAGFNVSRTYTPSITDYSTRSISASGHVFVQRKPRKYGLEFNWPLLTGKERLLMEQARIYTGHSKPVIVDVYDENDFRAHTDRVWGLFDEPIEIQRRGDAAAEYFTASALLMEH